MACLYVFLDEAGNFDFSPSGTRYFMLGSIALMRPFRFSLPLEELKFDLMETGKNIERFHASDDRQVVRNQVFGIIQSELDSIAIDATVVEKAKTGPALRANDRFYPEMLGYHLRWVLKRYGLGENQEIIVITDRIPLEKKRRAIEKAIKTTLAAMLPETAAYTLLHHDSKSCYGLQVADYCTWAIYRKWSRSDRRSYERIAPAIESEFDIFKRGSRLYY